MSRPVTLESGCGTLYPPHGGEEGGSNFFRGWQKKMKNQRGSALTQREEKRRLPTDGRRHGSLQTLLKKNQKREQMNEVRRKDPSSGVRNQEREKRSVQRASQCPAIFKERKKKKTVRQSM